MDNDLVQRKKNVTSAVAAAAVEGQQVKKSTRPQSQPPTPNNPGLTPPPFTLRQLREAVPPHCFERSAFRSGLYAVVDLLMAAALYHFVALKLDSLEVSESVRWTLWGAYWIVQGIVLTGVWVVAHECGHQAFSDSKLLNNTVGLILHSILLVPYHSWRISHAKHHKNTGHLENDEVFVPPTRTNSPLADSKLAKFPPIVLIRIVLMLTIGWPAYLFFNATGRQYDRPANHFSPSSPIFLPKQKNLIILSNVALLAWIGVLTVFAYQTSFLWLVKSYVIPYLFVNMWLVLITELQHTDIELPHYKDEEWTWLRGALCTVDRNYGILNYFFHHIGDTHICHHIFSQIPHYHAEEATEAMKKVLGHYYRQDNTPIAVALYNSMTQCLFVNDEEKTAWYLS